MNNSGFILLLAMLALTGLLLLGFSLLDHFMLQSKINHNLYLELKTYYLAQAGIEYATYRLKEDPSWRTIGWQRDLGTSGRIFLQVIDDKTIISVQATGEYRSSRSMVHALFTRSLPIQRLK